MIGDLFRRLFENSPVAKIVVEADGSISHANRQAARLFGYDHGELVHEKLDTLIPQGLRLVESRGRDGDADALETNLAAPQRNLHGVRKDGGLVAIEITLSPLEVDGHSRTLASIFDASARRLAAKRLSAAFEAAPNGMLMVDSARRILLANRQIETMFGFARDEILGQTIEVLIPAERRTTHVNAANGYMEQPTARPMGAGRDLNGRRKNGETFPVEVGLRPFSHEGETFVIGSVVDISARREIEAAVAQRTAEIEEFSYRTSHDLRSPLQSIATMAECVLEDIDAGDLDRARDGTARIGGLATKLLNLIEGILALTLVDRDDEPHAAFDFEAYAKTAADKFRSLADEHDVTLAFSFAHERALEVQAARLTQVLDNLISNGIKYADPARASRELRVRTSDDAEGFHIAVADDGIGIPEDGRDDLFAMFKRLHTSPADGTGLGLYIVQKQIEKLGATIDVESREDGTTFHVRIPAPLSA